MSMQNPAPRRGAEASAFLTYAVGFRRATCLHKVDAADAQLTAGLPAAKK